MVILRPVGADLHRLSRRYALGRVHHDLDIGEITERLGDERAYLTPVQAAVAAA